MLSPGTLSTCWTRWRWPSRSTCRCSWWARGLGRFKASGCARGAAAVLPKVQMIALREGRASEPNLWALGVAPERIVTTGDDAVEMAFCNHPQSLGDGIGFNLRMADYSAVSLKDGRRVAEIVRMFAQPHGAPVIPLPVSRAEEEADMETFRRLMPDAEGGQPRRLPLQATSSRKRSDAGLRSPEAIMQPSSPCRSEFRRSGSPIQPITSINSSAWRVCSAPAAPGST